MPLVELCDVCKSLGGVAILDGLSIRAEAGTVTGLFGPSGVGKTTALRLIAGLEAADSGRVLFDDKVVSSDGFTLPPESRELGMVFQDLALWPHMTVFRHLDFTLRGRGLSKKERKERAEAMLELVGLADKRKSRPAKLSGGEAQRLAIARAMVTDPPLMLLDEPFSNLDAGRADNIAKVIARRASDDKTTVFIASHERERLFAMSSQVVVMKSGGGYRVG